MRFMIYSMSIFLPARHRIRRTAALAVTSVVDAQSASVSPVATVLLPVVFPEPEVPGAEVALAS